MDDESIEQNWIQSYSLSMSIFWILTSLTIDIGNFELILLTEILKEIWYKNKRKFFTFSLTESNQKYLSFIVNKCTVIS